MPKPLIDMKNLTKKYTLGGETFKALDDVTFTVEQGEFLSIVGPSGSGKFHFNEYDWLFGCSG